MIKEFTTRWIWSWYILLFTCSEPGGTVQNNGGDLQYQFFQKEMKKQDLEILKLELEIRALKRAEHYVPKEIEMERITNAPPPKTTTTIHPFLAFGQRKFPFDFWQETVDVNPSYTGRELVGYEVEAKFQKNLKPKNSSANALSVDPIKYEIDAELSEFSNLGGNVKKTKVPEPSQNSLKIDPISFNSSSMKLTFRVTPNLKTKPRSSLSYAPAYPFSFRF